MTQPEAYPPTTAEAAAPAPVPTRTDLGLLLMVAIWAVNFSVIKVGLAALTPLAFNALRFPLAVLLVWAILRRRGGVPRPAPEDRRGILLLGLLGNAVYQFFFIFGLERTRAGNASLLLAGTPVLVALLSAALGHERVGRRVWLGVLATFAGMALVVVGGHSGLGVGGPTLVGDLIMLAASASWAAYTVGARGYIARYGAVAVTAWTLLTGTLVLFLAGLPDLARLDWGGVPPAAWGAVAFAGAFGIGLAYLLWYQGVHAVGNTRTAAYANLVPVVAILVAWGWLGEVPTLGQVAGAVVIIAGVTLVRT